MSPVKCIKGNNLKSLTQLYELPFHWTFGTQKRNNKTSYFCYFYMLKRTISSYIKASVKDGSMAFYTYIKRDVVIKLTIKNMKRILKLILSTKTRCLMFKEKTTIRWTCKNKTGIRYISLSYMTIYMHISWCVFIMF